VREADTTNATTKTRKQNQIQRASSGLRVFVVAFCYLAGLKACATDMTVRRRPVAADGPLDGARRRQYENASVSAAGTAPPIRHRRSNYLVAELILERVRIIAGDVHIDSTPLKDGFSARAAPDRRTRLADAAKRLRG
jgi:hypothetical protein